MKLIALKKTFYLLPFVLIVSCETPYKASGHRFFAPNGYTVSKLQEKVYQVSFKGNAYTTWERVNDFALLKSAQVTLEEGFSYFQIIDAKQATNLMQGASPFFGTNVGRGVSVGSTYTFKRPIKLQTIYCSNEKSNNQFSYDAKRVKENLIEKYELVLEKKNKEKGGKS